MLRRGFHQGVYEYININTYISVAHRRLFYTLKNLLALLILCGVLVISESELDQIVLEIDISYMKFASQECEEIRLATL